MPRIKILRSTICGKVYVKAGDTVDATDADARILLSIGKAELVSGEFSKKEPQRVAAPILDGEPVALSDLDPRGSSTPSHEDEPALKSGKKGKKK